VKGSVCFGVTVLTAGTAVFVTGAFGFLVFAPETCDDTDGAEFEGFSYWELLGVASATDAAKTATKIAALMINPTCLRISAPQYPKSARSNLPGAPCTGSSVDAPPEKAR